MSYLLSPIPLCILYNKCTNNKQGNMGAAAAGKWSKPVSQYNLKNKSKKKLKSLLMRRSVILLLLLLLQLGVLVGTAVYLSQAQFYLYVLLHLVSLLVVFVILMKKDNPSYKLGWIIPIMAVPLVGGLFYLVVGDKRIGRAMKKRIDAYARILERKQYKRGGYIEELRRQNPMQARQVEYIYSISKAALQTNTRVKYFPCGELAFDEMIAQLRQAQRFIMLEYFIIEEGLMWDTILEILEEKQGQGVEIRILYDDAGCFKTLPLGYDQTLREKGFQVVVFNPVQPRLNTVTNYRDHRKICVIDGNTGFTGGINLADEYINEVERFGHWKDTVVMLQGDGVWNLTEMFLQLWQFSSGEEMEVQQFRPTCSYPRDGYVQAFGDSPLDTLNVAENAYMQIINHAQRYVYITTPYLILDNEMMTALTIAAQSGIDVRIMTPHVPDKWYVHPVTRSYYLGLLEAGVRIFEYTPGFVHAKMFVSDDTTAIVGTTNMDYRSFYLHFECGVAFYNASVVLDVKEDFLKSQELCQEITLEEERQVNPLRRLGRSLLRLFAPLM